MNINNKHMLHLKMQHIFDILDDSINLYDGYSIYHPIFKEYNIIIDQTFIAILVELKRLKSNISYYENFLFKVEESLKLDKYINFKEQNCQSFYSLCYLANVFIKTGKYKSGILLLSLPFPNAIIDIINSYHEHFYGLIICDIDNTYITNKINEKYPQLNYTEGKYFSRGILPDGRIIFDKDLGVTHGIKPDIIIFNIETQIFDISFKDKFPSYDVTKFRYQILKSNKLILIFPTYIELLDLKTYEIKLIISDLEPKYDILVSPNQNILLIINENFVKAIDFNTYNFINQINTQTFVTNIEFINEGKILINSDSFLYIWNLRTLSFYRNKIYFINWFKVMNLEKVIIQIDNNINVYQGGGEFLYTISGYKNLKDAKILSNKYLKLFNLPEVFNIETRSIDLNFNKLFDEGFSDNINIISDNIISFIYDTHIEFWDINECTLKFKIFSRTNNDIEFKYGRIVIQEQHGIKIII